GAVEEPPGPHRSPGHHAQGATDRRGRPVAGLPAQGIPTCRVRRRPAQRRRLGALGPLVLTGPAQPHPRVRQDRRHDPKEQSRHHRGDRTATVERTPRRPQQQDPHDDPQSLWVPQPRGRPGPDHAHLRTDNTDPSLPHVKSPTVMAGEPANALALMGLRQLYLLIGGLLERIIHLNIGLSVILAFIGVKLIIEALHGSNVDAIGPIHLPETGIAASAGFVIVTIAVTTVSSLGKSSSHRRQLQANPVRSAELVPANDQEADAVATSPLEPTL